MSASSDLIIREMRPQDTKEVAQLHISGIPTGFISSLGIGFVTALYDAITKSKYGYGLVAQMDNRIVGFATFATDVSSLYKTVIFSKGPLLAVSLAMKMFSLRNVKKIFETLFYPSRVKKMNLPEAEFLSMVISEEARGKGLATQLVKKGFSMAAARGIEELKILAAVNIKPINAMYQKYGFGLVGQIESHGVLSNVYVVRTNHFGTDS